MAEKALIIRAAGTLPAIVAQAPENTRVRFLEFFAAAIRNPNTRRAYAHAVDEFLAWCEQAGVRFVTEVQPLHVAAWIELQHGRCWRRPSSSTWPRFATCLTGW